METHPIRIRPVRGERTPLVFLLVISALSALKLSRLFADYAGDPPFIDNEGSKSAIWSAEHPFIEKRDIKLEVCLTCHPGKQDAKFVHTAVGSGCENCHQAASENYKTTITLLATGGDLCAMCHVAKKDPVLHGPYKAGQCLVCHDPHTGAYKAELRATVNILCLSCHGLGQPNVKVDAQTKSVVILGDQKESFEEYARAPKIGGRHPENNPPGVAGGSVTAPEAEPDCLSCHDPHSSPAEHLLRKRAAVEFQPLLAPLSRRGFSVECGGLLPVSSARACQYHLSAPFPAGQPAGDKAVASRRTPKLRIQARLELSAFAPSGDVLTKTLKPRPSVPALQGSLAGGRA